MVSQNISGTHKRDIGDLIPHIVQTACAFKSVITFEVNDKSVNAKSIMGVMALASQNAPKISVRADGVDEEEAVKATGAETAKDMGKVMKELMPKVKGKADGKMVNNIVREFLK